MKTNNKREELRKLVEKNKAPRTDQANFSKFRPITKAMPSFRRPQNKV